MLKYEYLGMDLRVSEDDAINRHYFASCAAGVFSLQQCLSCRLLRYPPGAGCPWCGHSEYRWQPVEGRGTVYSYSEVTHAVQPGFAAHVPYMVLLVELDTQRGLPTPQDGLRVLANLVQPDGTLAPPDEVQRIGIGSRVRMVFSAIAADMALPQWTRDLEHLPADHSPPEAWRPRVHRRRE